MPESVEKRAVPTLKKKKLHVSKDPLTVRKMVDGKNELFSVKLDAGAESIKLYEMNFKVALNNVAIIDYSLFRGNTLIKKGLSPSFNFEVPEIIPANSTQKFRLEANVSKGVGDSSINVLLDADGIKTDAIFYEDALFSKELLPESKIGSTSLF